MAENSLVRAGRPFGVNTNSEPSYRPTCVFCTATIRLRFWRSAYLETSEVRDPRAADQVGDGLARVLDGPHKLLEVLRVGRRFVVCRKFGWASRSRKSKGGGQQMTGAGGGQNIEKGVWAAAHEP